MNAADSTPRPTPLQRLLDVLRRRDLAADRRPVHRELVVLFDEDGVDYQVLADAAFGMVKVGVQAKRLSDARDQQWDLPLLHKALRRGLLTDPDLEILFTVARRKYLEQAHRGEELQEHGRRMLVSLACQAFNNEYVWAADEAEQQGVDELAASVRVGGEAQITAVVACAMYMPLWQVVSSWPPSGVDSAVWPDLSDLVRQIRDRDAERRIADGIPSFEMSGDRVTERVRAQYEESPYPRWFGVTAVEPTSLAQQLQRRFASVDVSLPDRSLDVLVAGCGTGKEPISIVSRYRDVRVLAVDVSRASLAYAIRRAHELGLANLEFVHADLLNLKALGRDFDVVESVGVLHHLSDPTAGLRALVRMLRPNGLIKIGVYSRRARRDLVSFQARASAAQRESGSAWLRRVRSQILAGQEQSRLLKSRDFYYSSGCRDLLCHEHELTFTPADLKDWLHSCDLEFLGYVGLSEDTIAEFRIRHPSDAAMRDLSAWDCFEEDLPETFASLQVFWARRRDANRR